MLVALLAEGVDRNRVVVAVVPTVQWSPSSRRAWIEIRNTYQSREAFQVALLAEGVDRNFFYLVVDVAAVMSPSSRRAWIEMAHCAKWWY